MPKQLHPEVRDEVIRYMSTSMEVYLRELTSRYFKKPKDAESRQIMLEALAIAVTKLTADEPHAPAMLATFATELQDQQEPR